MSHDYHRMELEIALDKAHPKHILPPPQPEGVRILDVGCGAGQTLMAAYRDRVSVGIDCDLDALKLGRSLTDRVQFINGRAEALPFRDAQFDFVIGRVSLQYTDIGRSLREMRRVLTEGGEIWLTLQTPGMAWRQAKQNGPRGKAFFCYVLANSIWFYLTQKQLPYTRGRYESFQTESGMRRVLKRTGFEEIEIARGEHFVIRARGGGVAT